MDGPIFDSGEKATPVRGQLEQGSNLHQGVVLPADVQLRTLQCRVREWRHVMAQSLVNVVQNGNTVSEKAVVIGAEERK